jgi:hypothetical protein
MSRRDSSPSLLLWLQFYAKIRRSKPPALSFKEFNHRLIQQLTDSWEFALLSLLSVHSDGNQLSRSPQQPRPRRHNFSVIRVSNLPHQLVNPKIVSFSMCSLPRTGKKLRKVIYVCSFGRQKVLGLSMCVCCVDVDALMCWWLFWFVGALICWGMCWCVNDCVHVLVRWCVGGYMIVCWCVDKVDVSVCWYGDTLLSWGVGDCVDVLICGCWHSTSNTPTSANQHINTITNTLDNV